MKFKILILMLLIGLIFIDLSQIVKAQECNSPSCSFGDICLREGQVLRDSKQECENGKLVSLDTSKNSKDRTGKETEVADPTESTVCCEKTNSGNFCQDVPKTACDTKDNKFRSSPTSCESTTYCNLGYCFDTKEGTCLDNVPRIKCNEEGGIWNDTKPLQCDLGCCILGDQASFVTLVRCNRLSAFYGLETDWDPEIQDTAQCLTTAGFSIKGACVFQKDFDRLCKVTTEKECSVDNAALFGVLNPKIDLGGNNGATNNVVINGTPSKSPQTGTVAQVEFHRGKLCTAPELNTLCDSTKETICVPGKEEVYFLDSCGNAANVYDASKVNNIEYWSNIKIKTEFCNPDLSNENSQTCGNCNYILGTYCRESKGAKPTYGENICSNLNCVLESGEKRFHGESWCGYDVKGYDFSPSDSFTGELTETAVTNLHNDRLAKLASLISRAIGNVGTNSQLGSELLSSSNAPPGSKFYRYICNNGKVLIEPCADFRQYECIEDSIETNLGTFRQAACRVNRWQDCVAQTKLEECLNNDRRDCQWLAGIEYILMGSLLNGSNFDQNSLASAKDKASQMDKSTIPKGACVPKVPPGLNFWDSDEPKSFCAQANAICPVTYEKKALGGTWEPVGTISEICIDPKTQMERAKLCMSLGDCGPKINIEEKKGYGPGYTVSKSKLDDSKK